VLWYLLSYILVTPALAIGVVVFLLNKLFHGQGAKSFLKDLFEVIFVAPLWIALGFLAWSAVLTLGFFDRTRIAGWGLLISTAAGSIGYLIYMGGFSDPLILTVPAAGGVAIGAWQLRYAFDPQSPVAASEERIEPPRPRATSTGS
jgi:hypothetical protein